MKRSSQPSRTAAKFSESVHNHLNMYAMSATAAGVGLLALTQPAQARIVYTPAHVTIGDKMILDLNRDGINDFWFQTSLGNNLTWGWSDLGVNRSQNGNRIVAATGSGASAIALRAGDRIGSGRVFKSFASMAFRKFPITTSFKSLSTHWYGQWGNGGKGLKNRYLGLKFLINGKVHFGWARVTVTVGKSGNRDFTSVLTGYAYETIPNRPIIAGKTKGPDVVRIQPASLGQLATGASAIPAWRVKQTAATTH
jgi:hypothetical protein